MDKKETLFDYLGQIFTIFGITMCVLNIICILFGEDAREISTMFALGKEGISLETMWQFFGVSVCVVGLRYLFFTDHIIKKMSLTARTIGMVGCVILVMVIFILSFDWFPVAAWEPWAMFFLCFGISFGISMAVTFLKERMENQKMEQALERIKQENETNLGAN